MGGQHSAPTTPVVAQRDFPAVIGQRYVHDRTVRLRLQKGFWSHDNDSALAIVDLDTNHVMFKIPSQLTHHVAATSQRLLDRKGFAIASMDGEAVAKDCAMYVPVLSETLQDSRRRHRSILDQAACFFELCHNPLERYLRIEVCDPQSNEMTLVYVQKLFKSHETLFWMERSGSSCGRQCIARLCIDPESSSSMTSSRDRRSPVSLRTKYIVEIAAGVDVAFILLACAAMDEELLEKESDKEPVVSDSESTRQLAQRHNGVVPRPAPNTIGVVSTKAPRIK